MRQAPKGFFEGETVFVVGGGPSLSGFAWRRLDGHRVLAINRALEQLPDADMLWWSDAKFYRQHVGAIAGHTARLKATLQISYNPGELLEDIAVFHASGLDGFDEREGFIRHGNNSAYAAMHAAASLGAKRLVLLGVDMKVAADGRTHWHSGHKTTAPAHIYESAMVPQFRTLVEPLAQRGVEVLNGNPASALPFWRKLKNLDEVLG